MCLSDADGLCIIGLYMGMMQTSAFQTRTSGVGGPSGAQGNDMQLQAQGGASGAAAGGLSPATAYMHNTSLAEGLDAVAQNLPAQEIGREMMLQTRKVLGAADPDTPTVGAEAFSRLEAVMHRLSTSDAVQAVPVLMGMAVMCVMTIDSAYPEKRVYAGGRSIVDAKWSAHLTDFVETWTKW